MTPQPATITLFNGIIERRPRSADKKKDQIYLLIWLVGVQKKNNIQKHNVGKVVIINQHFLTQRGKIH